MRHVSLWKSHIGRYFLSVLKGLCLIAAGGFGIAGILLAGNLSAPVMVWLMHILWSAGAFTAGRCAGFHGRKHGILTGLLCGFCMSMLFLTGCVLLHEEYKTGMLIRFLMMFCAGIAGGIAGVNVRLKKPPY